MIYCEKGEYTIDRHTIHDSKSYGWLTVNKIIKLSSNIGAIKVGDALGSARLHRYLERFNFGERTGIDFPGESPGRLRPYKQWLSLIHI